MGDGYKFHNRRAAIKCYIDFGNIFFNQQDKYKEYQEAVAENARADQFSRELEQRYANEALTAESNKNSNIADINSQFNTINERINKESNELNAEVEKTRQEHNKNIINIKKQAQHDADMIINEGTIKSVSDSKKQKRPIIHEPEPPGSSIRLYRHFAKSTLSNKKTLGRL